MTTLQFWLLSIVTRDGTPVRVGAPGQWIVRVCVPVELRGDDAGGHGRNGDLFGSSNCIHFLVGEFDLPCIDVVDQFVAVHEVDANNVVV